MNFVLDNWLLIVSLLAVVCVVGFGVYRFFRLPTNHQLIMIKEWLLLAVTEAEAQLGDGTGKIKLRLVYDAFLMKFPWISRIISFDTFSYWVDEALLEMRELLATNENIKILVTEGEDK